MIGRMVWCESAAAPNGRRADIPRTPRAWVSSKPKWLKSRDFIRSFDGKHHVGFVRSVQPLGFARLRATHTSGPAAAPPRLDRRTEFYPISAALTTCI